MKPLFATVILAAAAMTAPATAEDVLVCMPTLEMEAALQDWYGERPVTDKDSNGHMVWSAGIGKSWTLVSYGEDGMSCSLAAGENWSPVDAGDDLYARLSPGLR